MVVEELLKFLVDKVDGDLLKAIVLKDLETSDVKHSTEVGLLHSGVNECVVTLDDQPFEDSIEDGPGNTSSGTSGLFTGLTLGHPLSSDLDPGLAERLEHDLGVNTKGSCCLSWETIQACVGNLCLVVATLGLINNTTASHHTGGQHVAIKLLLWVKSKDIEGILSVEELLIVINGVDLGLTLGDIDVVIDVSADKALGTETSFADA